MALKQEELFKLDLYELLDLEAACTLQDVKKAFRKKALKCHPDKNPDNPNAAQLFHQLSCALEILCDSSARAAYDKVLNGRKAAKIRNQQLDSRIKKLKKDLEERERSANNSSSVFSDEKKLQAEVERLRKEGSRLLQEEMAKMHKQFNNNAQKEEEPKRGFILTVRWHVEENDSENGGYTESLLRKMLSKYGEVVALVISPNKKGKALVEFKTSAALKYTLDNERGLSHNPLFFQQMGGFSKGRYSTERSSDQTNLPERHNLFPSFVNKGSTSGVNHTPGPSEREFPYLRVADIESVVLGRLRLKERMKRAAQDEDEK